MQVELTSRYKDSKAIFIILENKKLPIQLAELLPTEILAEVKKQLQHDFEAKFMEVNRSLCINGKKALQLFLVGLGEKNKQPVQKLRKLGSKIVQAAIARKMNDITLITSCVKNESDIAGIFEGVMHGNYKFDRFITKKNKEKDKLHKLTLIDHRSTQTKFKECLAEIKKVVIAINYVKDLVNTPSLSLTPSTLVEEAIAIGKASNKKIKVKHMGESELEKLGLNMILSVGQGSGQESKLITLEYNNNPINEKPLVIVGKGVTFDAGGLHLKPTNNIETMKMDMAGAATVLGLFKLLTEIDLPIHIIGVIPSVENLLGHNAYKPGDILTAYNGKTVEITNTDAEGRLILGDAISYAKDKFNPEAIVDIATLTGACVVALGYVRTGLISNNKQLSIQFKNASKSSGDLTWRLPLDNFHRDKVKGSISDYKNWTAGVNAGAIMGAAFIEKFVGKTPWVHLDIAGSSFVDLPVEYKQKGATGEPLKLLYHFLKNYEL